MIDEAATTPPRATAADLAALAVPTVIWFGNDGDRLSFHTGPEAGKVERIRAKRRIYGGGWQ